MTLDITKWNVHYWFEIMEQGGDDASDYYDGGEIPPFGTIDAMDDLMVALHQKIECESCEYCYWSKSNGGDCSVFNVDSEIDRVVKLCEKASIKAQKSKQLAQQVKCGDCVYASQTNPKICMCPHSIAKHSYVQNDNYCDKGEKV